MCSTMPSLLNIGRPASRAAAIASAGTGHGGRLSTPTAVVAGGFSILTASAASDSGRSLLVAMTITTTRATTTAIPAAAQLFAPINNLRSPLPPSCLLSRP